MLEPDYLWITSFGVTVKMLFLFTHIKHGSLGSQWGLSGPNLVGTIETADYRRSPECQFAGLFD